MLLTFQGPYKFMMGKNYLFNTEFLSSEGIYLWTIKDEKHNLNYVHYIGETTAVFKRLKEHLINITGLNYRIIDAQLAKIGIENIIWNGLWRDKTSDGAAKLLENYSKVSRHVIDYIALINIYFAPVEVDANLRKRIEASISTNLRLRYPQYIVFYPGDNRVSVFRKRLNKKIEISLPEKINGMDTQIII